MTIRDCDFIWVKTSQYKPRQDPIWKKLFNINKEAYNLRDCIVVLGNINNLHGKKYVLRESPTPSFSTVVSSTKTKPKFKLVIKRKDNVFKVGEKKKTQKRKRCHFCAEKFSSTVEMYAHLVKAHVETHKKPEDNEDNSLNDTTIYCPVCVRPFSSQSALTSHLSVHTVEEETNTSASFKFRCHICKEKFTELVLLREHKKERHEVSTAPSKEDHSENDDNNSLLSITKTTKCYLCSSCDERFERFEDFAHHNKEKHNLYTKSPSESLEFNKQLGKETTGPPPLAPISASVPASVAPVPINPTPSTLIVPPALQNQVVQSSSTFLLATSDKGNWYLLSSPQPMVATSDKPPVVMENSNGIVVPSKSESVVSENSAGVEPVVSVAQEKRFRQIKPKPVVPPAEKSTVTPEPRKVQVPSKESTEPKTVQVPLKKSPAVLEPKTVQVLSQSAPEAKTVQVPLKKSAAVLEPRTDQVPSQAAPEAKTVQVPLKKSAAVPVLKTVKTYLKKSVVGSEAKIVQAPLIKSNESRTVQASTSNIDATIIVTDEDDIETKTVAPPDREQPLSCGVCFSEFTNKEQYQKHVVEHQVYYCSICMDKFNSINGLKKHVETHTNEKKQKTANTGPNIIGHTTSTLNTRVKCSYCSKIFINRKFLARHLQLSHQKTTCHVCFVEFPPEQLAKHFGAVHRKKKNVVTKPATEQSESLEKQSKPSEEPNKSDQSASEKSETNQEKPKIFIKNLKDLMGSPERHKEKNKTLICVDCGGKFRTADLLLDHMRQARFKKCTQCNYSTCGVLPLNRHYDSEHRIWIYRCTCGVSFNKRQDFEVHLVQVHEREVDHDGRTKVKFFTTPVQCSVCAALFSNFRLLNSHLQTQHSDLIKGEIESN